MQSTDKIINKNDYLNNNSFDVVGVEDNFEEISRPRVSYYKDAWRRFKNNKVALFALLILIGLIIFVIFPPILSDTTFDKIDKTIRNLKPSAEHWFGTDKLGRDMFLRVSVGGRVSIAIGLIGAFSTSIIGCIYGGLSAYFGGRVDDIMMRIVEILICIPYLILVILMSLIFESKSMGTLILAMIVTGWCGVARLVRGQILQIKSEEYILAAKAMGVSSFRIVTKYMIPNVIGIVIVQITFAIPGYIFGEAFLSYIGLGIQSPDTSWGALASSAQPMLAYYPYQLLFPSLMIALTMLSFTLVGDGLRDALDPKMRK